MTCPDARIPGAERRASSVGARFVTPLADLSIAMATAGLIDVVVRMFVECGEGVMKFDGPWVKTFW